MRKDILQSDQPRHGLFWHGLCERVAHYVEGYQSATLFLFGGFIPRRILRKHTLHSKYRKSKNCSLGNAWRIIWYLGTQHLLRVVDDFKDPGDGIFRDIIVQTGSFDVVFERRVVRLSFEYVPLNFWNENDVWWQKHVKGFLKYFSESFEFDLMIPLVVTRWKLAASFGWTPFSSTV